MPRLSGIKQISAYANRSDATILDWIRTRGFPADKFGGGIWESETEAVDYWFRKTIWKNLGVDPEDLKPQIQKKRVKQRDT